MREVNKKMSEEREVLSQVVDPRAGLFPAYESGAAVLREIVGYFVGDFSIITDIAIESLASSGFFETLKGEARIERGDVQYIVGKFAKLNKITLTNKNILLLYKKGWRSKQSKLIVFPLKYATEVLIAEGTKRMVKTKEGRIRFEKEAVYVIFQVSQKGQDKLHYFSLALSVDNPWIWTKAIERVIGLDLTKTKAKEKVCRIVNVAVQGRRYAHVLCFTQKRMIVSKYLTRSLLGRILLLIPLPVIGFLLFLLSALAVVGAIGLRVSFAEILSNLEFQLIFISGPILWGVFLFSMKILRRRRLRSIIESPPKILLESNALNFEIPYGDVTQVKVKDHGRFSRPFPRCARVEITAKNGKHDFKIMKKAQFLDFMQLIQRFLPERKILME